ncbi:sensor histidine kinase [Pueribacillus theae]|uniref:sensor histidine kinase n=1 Tax=Pueribacillus theae TaxID=2171751 RepID=UPI0026842F12
MIFKKIYPLDQVEKYLLIDVIAIVFLIYNVMKTESSLGLSGKLLLVVLLIMSHYVCLWYKDWRLLVACLSGFGTLVILGVFLQQWLFLYGFIFADLLGRANRKVYIGVGMFGIVMMYSLFSWLTNGHPLLFAKTALLPFMIVQLFIPIVVYTKEKAKALQGKLDTANARLARYIQEEERHRIARDLHDILGQTLTMIKLKSELTIKLVEKDSKQAKQELKDILNTSRFALKQVRELVADMKFVSLEKEIEESKKILQTAGIELTMVEKGKLPLLSSVTETMLALSLRETITNIIKHSQAKHCTITKYYQDNVYCLQIIDDGNGDLKAGKGNGIRSIQERMEKLQGTAEMNASLHKGVSVTLKVPVRTNEGENAI